MNKTTLIILFHIIILLPSCQQENSGNPIQKEIVETNVCSMDDSNGKPGILIVGDSVSTGYTSRLKRQFPSNQVIHNSCNARNTRNGIENINEWASHLNQWEICTINHGLHDIHPAYRVEVDEYLSNLEYEIDVLGGYCKKIIFVTTTIVDDSFPTNRNPSDVDIYNDEAVNLMDNLNIPVCDLNQFSYSQIDNLYDAVHYNSDGYDELADYVGDCIREL